MNILVMEKMAGIESKAKTTSLIPRPPGRAATWRGVKDPVVEEPLAGEPGGGINRRRPEQGVVVSEFLVHAESHLVGGIQENGPERSNAQWNRATNVAPMKIE